MFLIIGLVKFVNWKYKVFISITFCIFITISDFSTLIFLFLTRDILTGQVLTEYNKRKTSNAYKIAEVDQDTLFNNMKRRQLTVI